MSYPSSYEDYNQHEEPDGNGVWIAAAVIIGLLLCACMSGCYGSPIDTRAIDADKVTIVHSTPWTTLTIQAEGWHSTVKTTSEKKESK